MLQIPILALWTKEPLTNVAVASSAMQLFCAFVVVILVPLEHDRTTRPSTLITVYLVAAIVTDGVQIRTLFGRSYVPTIARLVSASTGTKAVLLILESWPKTSYLVLSTEELGPEDISGPFARHTFWWLNPLLLLGNRNLLSFNDLPLLDRNLLSEPLRKRMARSWAESKYEMLPNTNQ